mmetsp:Transcript_803/g.2480  ORF Transcript_803/g.2480 Transcript_803/m.2480 type:complete len:236 (-) Transcript_803:104-811(-)
MFNDGGRYHITDVLRIPSHCLERDADAFPCLIEHRATGVSAVDGCINLDTQKLVAAVGVGGDLNPAYHSRGDTDGLAAQRVPHHRHCILQVGQAAEGDGLHALVELLVLHRQHRDVALEGHRQHLGYELAVVPPPLHLHLGMVFHRVGVGEQPPLAFAALNQEAGAVAGILTLALPWQAVVGLSVHAVHLHHRVHVLPHPSHVIGRGPHEGPVHVCIVLKLVIVLLLTRLILLLV